MGPITLLYVGDNPQLLQLRKNSLEPYGYCVEIASTGESAISTLKKEPGAVVLLECKEEYSEAEEVAVQIKREFPAQPIILVSTHGEVPERLLWLVDDYMMGSDLPEGLPQVIQRTMHLTRNDKAQIAAA